MKTDESEKRARRRERAKDFLSFFEVTSSSPPGSRSSGEKKNTSFLFLFFLSVFPTNSLHASSVFSSRDVEHTTGVPSRLARIPLRESEPTCALRRPPSFFPRIWQTGQKRRGLDVSSLSRPCSPDCDPLLP